MFHRGDPLLSAGFPVAVDKARLLFAMLLATAELLAASLLG